MRLACATGVVIGALVAAPAPAAAQQPAPRLLECLRQQVVVTAPAAVPGRLTFQVENRLEWTLAGLRFDYRVTSVGRVVPWERDAAAVAVRGGIEPGETRTVSVALLPIPAEVGTVGALSATVELLDVADAENRLFIGDVRVVGWSDDPSPQQCE